MATAVTAMNPAVFVSHYLIEIRVTHPVFTDALHDATICSPHLRPICHVVIRWIMYTAILTLADFLAMYIYQDLIGFM